MMETVDVKFDWSSPSIKENKGHTQSEWGKFRKPYYLVSYKTVWE